MIILDNVDESNSSHLCNVVKMYAQKNYYEACIKISSYKIATVNNYNLILILSWIRPIHK